MDGATSAAPPVLKEQQQGGGGGGGGGEELAPAGEVRRSRGWGGLTCTSAAKGERVEFMTYGREVEGRGQVADVSLWRGMCTICVLSMHPGLLG